MCPALAVGPVSDFFLHHGFFLPSKMKEEVKMGWGGGGGEGRGGDNIKLWEKTEQSRSIKGKWPHIDPVLLFHVAMDNNNDHSLLPNQLKLPGRLYSPTPAIVLTVDSQIVGGDLRSGTWELGHASKHATPGLFAYWFSPSWFSFLSYLSIQAITGLHNLWKVNYQMLVISPSKWPENILLCWLIAPEALTEFPPTVANLITSPTVQAINKVLTQCASNA